MSETAPAKWWQQKSIVITGIVAAAIVAIVAIGAIGSGKQETTATVAPAPETSAPVAPAPAPAPETAAPAPSPSTEAPAPAPAPTTKEPAPAAAAPASVAVPNVVGMNYQKAQDLLRSQGLLVMPATDGSGANRIPILDANWIVTGQDIAPGTTVDAGTGVTCTIIKSTD